MTKQHDDGGPAFPNDGGPGSNGMTLLDYFAAAAMQGWLASYGPESRHPAHLGEINRAATVAADAYRMAAAMIAEKRRREAHDEV